MIIYLIGFAIVFIGLSIMAIIEHEQRRVLLYAFIMALGSWVTILIFCAIGITALAFRIGLTIEKWLNDSNFWNTRL